MTQYPRRNILKERSHFQSLHPSQIFEGKAGAYPNEAPFFQALPENMVRW